MKKNIYIQYLSRAVMALAVVGAMTSCAEDAGLFDIFQGGDGTGLSVAPVVSEPTVVTRAESVEALNEKQLNTLDVFVEHVTSGTGDGTFMKQYHLVASASTPIQVAANNWLADNWRAEGLVVGEKYNIYVAANNTKTKADVASVEALKALIYSEVEEGIAVVDEATNNIAWPWTDQFANTPSGFIYKQYVAEADADAVKVNGSLYGFTTEKEFMMDDVLENWTPVANERDQVFQPVELNRAAAKIVLNVKFDADFLKSLTQEKKTVDGVETWVDKPAEKQVKIQADGKPAWRFYNFAFGAPVFAPETQGAGVEVHNSATLLRHPYGFVGDDKNFRIITYTYPNMWAQADYATKAPSLVISIPYIEGTSTEPIFHYYRIPIVKSDVTKIERNHIYVVNATIATRGSELHEDEDLIEDVHYYVLPWNDETNSAAIKNEVEAVQHYYLKVNPKIYTLRGDGAQSVDINYLKASGTSVGWKLFTYDANGNQTAVVANNADGATRAWFYNSTGAFTSTYSDTGSGITWGNTMGVNITQSTEGVSGSSGKFTVTSQALTNKAIKYIRFRVFLNEEETLYEDVIIRHFPTDNIQNISGHWSSYHPTGASDTQMVTLTTRTLSEAQSWAEQYGVEYTTTLVPTTEIISYAEYSTHANMDGYSAEIVNGVSADDMYQATGGTNWNSTIASANSQANAFLSDQWYYWGENPVASSETTTNPRNYNYEYDYYTSRSTGGWISTTYYTYYRYTARHRAQYTHEYSYNLYSVTVPMASTGSWVDWDNRTSHRPARTYTITYGNNAGTFNAKVYENGRMYGITERSSGNNYTTEFGSAETLTNYHMYVIQISSTSDEYVLGRPYVNQTTHQSNDNVVSPAFMIASQLGAVLPFTGNNGPANAATHCSQYMEVAQDGTRYTGWRLPTEAEISVITEYQYGNINGVTIDQDYRVLIPVLTGRYYHSLSGQEVEANPNAGAQSQTKSYLRCVRDLSAEEVERLNGFDKIIDKYQNK